MGLNRTRRASARNPPADTTDTTDATSDAASTRVDPAEGDPARKSSRVVLSVVSVAIVVQTCLQQPGRIVHETRLDLASESIAFMSQTWHLWQSAVDMGRVQNQAVGYLFPMGPFFAAGHLANVPTWLIQRLWVSAILVVALWGAARLADELRLGVPWTRVLGATAYAVAPVFLARAGTTSAFVIGGALLPWTLVPLVRGARTGNVRSAACWSALAVLAMGGVNASVTAAVLVMPFLYLLTRARSPVRARLLRWWIFAVALACAWWFLPLLFQGAYGADFLSITERASVITAVTGPFEVVRGTADWLAYYNGGVALPAGFFTVSNPWAIAATGLIAAAGLAGLTRRDLPERRFLTATFLLGVAVLGSGYGGALGNPLATFVTDALDGPLSFFRTLYKIAPIIALPLALGLAHIVASATNAARDRAPSRVSWLAAAPGVIAVGILLLAALPLFTQRLLGDRGFDQVPAWWTETADYLEATPGRALLVPGLPQSDHRWGYTEEEPLQWLSDAPWATRSIAPLGGEGTIEYLDTVEAAIGKEGDPSLPAYLSRAGFSSVVARNDAQWAVNRAPSPIAVNDALTASGLVPVASFGPPLPRPEGLDTPELHQIEIYGVPGASRAVAYAQESSLLVSGGIDSLLTIAGAGLGDRAVILGQDVRGDQPLPPNWVVTDGNQRRYISFGRNRDNRSYLLGPAQDSVPGQTPGQGFFSTVRPESQTVVELAGVAEITASSYGSRSDILPELAPDRAFDGDAATAWVAAPAGVDSVGEWLQVDLAVPSSVEGLSAQMLADGPWRPQVDQLRVITDQGSVVTDIEGDESAQVLAVPPGPTSRVRIVIESIVDGTDSSTGAGIRELTIPGLDVERVVTVPSEFKDDFSEPSANLPTYLFSRIRANPSDLGRRPEEVSMTRRFEVPRPGTWDAEATVAPVPSRALLDLIDTNPTLAIAASSTAGNLPRLAPGNLVDGEESTIWVAATTNGSAVRPVTSAGPAPSTYDPAPSVTMRWTGPRTLDQLSLRPVATYTAPYEVTITAGTETRTARVPDDGVVRFEALSTDEVTVTFTRNSRVLYSEGPSRLSERPLALSELRFPALDDLVPPAPSPEQDFTLSCADGPEARVGDSTTSYSATFTYRDLVDLRPVTAIPCSPRVSLPAGEATLTTSLGLDAFTIDHFSLLSPTLTATEPSAPAREITFGPWGDADRALEAGPGPASYLVVNESFNEGWQASLNGESLSPIRIDGWRQGYALPAGPGGTVSLSYAPTGPYRAALMLGGLGVLALIGLTIVFVRRERRTTDDSLPLPLGTWGTASSVVAALVTSVAVAGFGGLLLVLLWFLVAGRRTLLPWIAGGAFALAALWAGWTQEVLPTTSAGTLGSVPNLLALLALLAVSASLLPERSRRVEHPSQDDQRTQRDHTASR